MSLLIDVLTKSDQANRDATQEPPETAQSESDHDDTQTEAPSDQEPDLSLAPDELASGQPSPDDVATHSAGTGGDVRADDPATENPASDDPAPDHPPGLEADVHGSDYGDGTLVLPASQRRAKLPSMLASKQIHIGAIVVVATLGAGLFLADAWFGYGDLTPIEDATVADVATTEDASAAAPAQARGPAEIGPPLDAAPAPEPVEPIIMHVAEFDTPVTPIDPGFAPDRIETEPPREEADRSDARIVVQKSNRNDPIFRHMRRAYDAFRSGDYTAAIDSYRAALALDPLNHDALLGLAALALRTGDAEQARIHYQATLELDPQNSIAIAGLVALQEGGSPIDRESYLKNMLYDRPTAAHLYFSLGLQYASQARWSDAQQAFFDAFSNDSSNADYAFNLAVSLDRLGQARSAADYYRRSLDLASGNHVIDMQAARARLEALQSAGGGGAR
ncbi:MAG: tetratricopeptide repeat protein [Gammaproteobacteria bacterium]